MSDSKSKRNGFLTDDQGSPSSMRLMSVLSLIVSFAFGLITILCEPADSMAGLYLTTAFLIGAFFPKALQKFAEARFFTQ